jgi:gephyrin
MGDRDFVKPLLARLGRVIFGRLNMKPGKPTTLAVLERRPLLGAAAAPGGVPCSPVLVFALPGNPVSAWVGAHVLVAPALRHMAGVPWAAAVPPAVTVRVLDKRLRLDAERPEFHRATAWAAADGSGLVARSTGAQASSRSLSLSGANSLLWLPPDPAGGGVLAGPALVRAHLIGPLLAEGAVDEAVRTGARVALGGGSGDCRCGRAVPLTAPPASPGVFAPHVVAPAERVPVSLCVLTVSDRCARGAAVDTSGPAIVRHLTTASPRLAVTVVECVCVPDDEAAICSTVARWCGIASGGNTAPAGPAVASLVITTGGTGFGPRDVTPEALHSLLRRPAPGLVHAMLEVGRAATPLAALSRYEAGVAGVSTLVVEVPGSAKAVAECLGALDPLLPHVLSLLAETPKADERGGAA